MNFVGAAKEIKELYAFLQQTEAQNIFCNVCSSQGIQWHFTSEHVPHFGSLWEAAVKSMKYHLCRVISDVKLTYEVLHTMLTEVRACLNFRPLLALPHAEGSLVALTPGHFLIGAPIKAVLDGTESNRPMPLLRRWSLCQALTQHFYGDAGPRSIWIS